ncbi:MAG: hypothetical protein P1U56_17720 [Saprospiraceae bacterium]|nr:hypothetical protein [Saprospiraceae bacterium]
MNAEEQRIFDKQVKELTTLHYALVGGLIMINGVLYTQMKDPHFDIADNSDIFLYIVPLLAIALIFLAQNLFKNKLEKIHVLKSIEEKLAAYRVASVQKFALIEGPALISLVLGFVNGNLIYSIIGASLTVYLFLQRVSEEQVKNDLHISG